MQKNISLEGNNFAAIFRDTARKNPGKTCMKHRLGSVWTDISWAEALARVDALSSWLIASGINPGDNIAIYSENRPEWVFADLAVLSAGAADVTIYPTNSGPEAAFILNDSRSRYCFCSGSHQVENLLENKEAIVNLEKIIVFDDWSGDDPLVISLDDAIRTGTGEPRPSEIENRIRSIDPESVMTLIYTSGTTGNPKGVMLTHNNMVIQARQFLEHHPFPFDALALSILPLSHSLERTVGYHSVLMMGETVAYSRGPEHLLEDLLEVQPTVFLVVPRVLEKLYQGIVLKVNQAPPARRRIFRWAERTARRASHFIAANRRLPVLLGLNYRLAEKLVYSKLREAIGMGRMRCIGIGGAPLSRDIYEFFLGIGLECHIGFGLTETSPVTHVHTYHWIKPIKMDTAGPIIPRTQCRIADDGEILIKGPQVMKGYYNRPDATKEVFDEEGWFKTGDIGTIDDEGYLRITDRKKDIIVTSGGKNIAPQVIENHFKTHPLIEQIAIIGDRRKFLVALIVPSFESLMPWALENGISEADPSSLIRNRAVLQKYDQVVNEMNRPLGRVEQVKRFTLLSTPFSQEAGELTPTLKVKRKAVSEKYSGLIEGLYEGEE
jgi:long-chain acyl-CoA synthetase